MYLLFFLFVFVLFCFVFYQAHLLRVTFKFTTTVWFICFFLKNQRTIWYFTLANIDIGKLKLCVFHSPLVIEKTVFPVVLFKQTLNQSVSFMFPVQANETLGLNRLLLQFLYSFQFTCIKLIVNSCIKHKTSYVNHLTIPWAKIYILSCMDNQKVLT